MKKFDARQALTDEEAADIALSLSPLGTKVIQLCSKQKSWGYSRLSEQTASTYAEVRDIGRQLQKMKLANIRPVRHGQEFHGSAIFLNDRGEHVKRAVGHLERLRGI